VTPADRKLLVLDLDETLLYATETPLSRAADFRVGPYHVYRRPHLDPFLAGCFDRFEVAVWTSSSPLYAWEVVRSVFPFPERLAFVWASDRCTQAFCPETYRHFWRKPLRKLTRRGYARERLIAVDDSPEKWHQSYGNLVRVRPYFGDPADGELPLLLRYLERLADVEDVRAVEKRFWRSEVG
jgi:TFIIF-interacting CTD phosphatase-like protein